MKYDEDFYDGQKVTQSKMITFRQYSIVSKMAFEIYALNHDLNVLNECLRIDKKTQREAAIEAVRHVGMHQIKDIEEEIFEDMTEWKEMFFRRLEELNNALDTSFF